MTWADLAGLLTAMEAKEPPRAAADGKRKEGSNSDLDMYGKFSDNFSFKLTV